MRKHIITLSLLLLVTVSFAQMQVAVGLKGGLNLSSFNVSYEASCCNEGKNYKSLLGYHAGVFASLKFNKLVVQPEILYSQQGTKFAYSGWDSDDWQSDFTYINIPVLVKYSIVQTGIGDITIQAGPQFGLLQKAETNFYDFDGDGAQERPKTDVKEDYKKSDLGLILGAGWDLPFGLSLDVRYNLGLQNIGSYEGDNGPKEIKNQVLQVSVGYKLLKFGR
ncbi:MAG: PorT family protein [Cyclobacteriaceae bacterium]|nr:PorT family protein [Cyclobacteriaceae bacterium]